MKISYRLVIIIAVFITCLITANTIAVKMIHIGPFTLFAAIFVFPLSYIVGDVLTEVYGYRVARRVIWLGFACNLIFVFFVWLGQVLPAATAWEGQAAYKSILGSTPRFLVASFCGYLTGEFSNSYILSRMKILTKGRWLWSRTIGSTIIGEGLDTVVFTTVATAGTSFFMPSLMLNQWIGKVLIETVFTPVTYAIVNWLKHKENVDTYDYSTNYNPFTVAEKEKVA
jgi:queuosine precursor transporter